MLCLRNVVPAPFTGPRVADAAGSVLFSATLTPWPFVRDLLGLPAEARCLELPTPFDPRRLSVRLAGRLWLPEGAGPVPVILEYLPYRKRDGTRARDERMHRYLARHGYGCLRLDIRGTGDSEGVIDDEYSVQEQIDGLAAIDWIARQPWCDGQVAMIGISWGGFNGLQIAARRPNPRRVRTRLPARLAVLTLVTVTPNTCSTAILIWVLLASGSTMNVYLFSSSRP